MGTCVSRQRNCADGKLGGSKRKKIKCRRRRKGLSKRAPSFLSDRSSERVEKLAPLPENRSFTGPTFQGNEDEAWFESAVYLESDWSDEDFQSIPDGMYESHAQTGVDGEFSSVRNSFSGSCESSLATDAKQHVYLDEISETSGGGDGDDSALNNCGIIPNNCLPCLASAVNNNAVDKRRSLTSSPPVKKSSLKLSFRWKEGHPTAALFASKMLLEKPIAGSQVPFCPSGKRVPDSWSVVEPGTFKVRGVNYLRDRRKELAPNTAAYYPFGVDVFLSQRKINHIARFVELPPVDSSEKLPPLLIVNVQIPIYPAAFFQGETDGEGISFVLYFKLSESYAEDLPAHFQDHIRKVIEDEAEKVKSFRSDSAVAFRERVKVLGRVANVDDLPMSTAERKLMQAYNEKPVLSRPQHEFYPGGNYLEMDLDMHRFGYISRKGFETFLDRLKLCVLDVGLTIQGNKAEELPEHLLCCVRLNQIDFVNYHLLHTPPEE
ncbi:hypothetical protein M569_15079, partial [Genlisea aurea]